MRRERALLILLLLVLPFSLSPRPMTGMVEAELLRTFARGSTQVINGSDIFIIANGTYALDQSIVVKDFATLIIEFATVTFRQPQDAIAIIVKDYGKLVIDHALVEFWTKDRVEYYNNTIQAFGNASVTIESSMIYYNHRDSDVEAPDNQRITKAIGFLEKNKHYWVIGYQPSTNKPSFYEKVVKAKGIDFGFSFTLMRTETFRKMGEFNVKTPSIEDTELFTRMAKSGMKMYCDSKTVFRHLKPDNFKITYFDYLKFAYKLGSQGFDSLTKISWFQKFRVIYYLLLPFTLLTAVFIHWAITIAYLTPLLLYQTYRAKENRLYGIYNFFVYIPGGLAMSYGYLVYNLKEKFRR